MTQPAHTEEPTYATHDIEICIVGVCSAADVAQLAEQLICNQQVKGSSPFISFPVIKQLQTQTQKGV